MYHTDDVSHHSPRPQSPTNPPSSHLIPPEIWYQIFLVLFHGVVEEQLTLGEPGVTLSRLWCGRAFISLSLTRRALYLVGSQVRKRLHVIAGHSRPKGSLDLGRFSDLVKEFEQGKPEIIVQGPSQTADRIVPCVIKWFVGLERLELVRVSLYVVPPPDGIQKRDTLRRLKIRNCPSLSHPVTLPPDVQDDYLYRKFFDLRRSKVIRLELDYTSWEMPELPQGATLLTLMPSLRTLVLCAKSFVALAELPQTLSIPPLQHLIITDDQHPSITRALVVSYLERCPTLETLHIDNTIRTEPAPDDIPTDLTNLPSLREYEGPVELLVLVKAPNLRRALATGLEWDGGGLIYSLATTSEALQSLVIELTATTEDPVCQDIKAWVQRAAAKWDPRWGPPLPFLSSSARLLWRTGSSRQKLE